MPNLVTLSELRAACRLAAEIPAAIADSSIDIWINQGKREFERWLLSCNIDWKVSQATISATGLTDTYSLPADFMAVRRLTANDSQGDVELVEISINELPSYDAPAVSQWPVYWMSGESSITLRPAAWSGTLKLVYVPVPPKLVSGTDSFDAHMIGDQIIVAYVGARFCRRMAESRGEQAFLGELEKLKLQGRMHVSDAVRGRPRRVHAAVNVNLWPLGRRFY